MNKGSQKQRIPKNQQFFYKCRKNSGVCQTWSKQFKVLEIKSCSIPEQVIMDTWYSKAVSMIFLKRGCYLPSILDYLLVQNVAVSFDHEEMDALGSSPIYVVVLLSERMKTNLSVYLPKRKLDTLQ